MHVLQQITGFTDKPSVYTIIDIERLINSWIGNQKQIPLVIIERIEKFSDLNAPLLQKNNGDLNNSNTGQYKHTLQKLCILIIVFIFIITLSLHYFSFPSSYILSRDSLFIGYKPDFRDPLWPNNDIYFIESTQNNDGHRLEIACNFMISGKYQFISTSNGVFTYRKSFGSGDIIIDAHHTQLMIKYIGNDQEETLIIDFVYDNKKSNNNYVFIKFLSITRCDGRLINDIGTKNINDFTNFDLILIPDSQSFAIQNCQNEGNHGDIFKSSKEFTIFANEMNSKQMILKATFDHNNEYKTMEIDGRYLDFIPTDAKSLHINKAAEVAWNGNTSVVCKYANYGCYQLSKYSDSAKHWYAIICPTSTDSEWILHLQRFEGGFDYLRDNGIFLYHSNQLTRPTTIYLSSPFF